MKKNKQMISLALMLGVVISLGLYEFSKANDSKEEKARPREAIIEKLASTFNLDEDEIRAVFEENREETQERRQAKMEERLDKAVSNGEITEDQKNLILEKRAQMREERESNKEEMKDLSKDERKEKREERRAALEEWAEENGIDVKYITNGPNGPGRSR